MKSYTDFEQSKKLAEIISPESADMCWWQIYDTGHISDYVIKMIPYIFKKDSIPCWSLAALLNVLSSASLDSSNDHYYRLHCMERYTEWYDNPVDACVNMIIKLKELKLL